MAERRGWTRRLLLPVGGASLLALGLGLRALQPTPERRRELLAQVVALRSEIAELEQRRRAQLVAVGAQGRDPLLPEALDPGRFLVAVARAAREVGIGADALRVELVDDDTAGSSTQVQAPVAEGEHLARMRVRVGLSARFRDLVGFVAELEHQRPAIRVTALEAEVEGPLLRAELVLETYAIGGGRGR